jgi:putative addiction module CopG family antidote
MISVQLTEDLESFIRDSVRTGRYANPDAVISDALSRLRLMIDTGADPCDEGAESSGPAKRLTKQEFQRHLVEIGLLDQPPKIDRNAGSSHELIDDEGEIVDEVIIRERLIEWLTGFL